MRKFLLSLTVLCMALLAPLSLQSQAQTAAAATLAPARVIVKFKAGSALLRERALSVTQQHANRAEALGQRMGMALRSGAGVAERTQVLLANGVTSADLAQRLSREGDVEYAVVDQRRRRLAAPSDPLYAAGVPGNGPAVGQWYLRAPVGTVQSSLDVEAAWAVSTGSAAVVVAVLDTGVRFDHPDLQRAAAGGNLLPGYDMISDLDVANDGNGRDADPSDPGDWLTLAEVSQVGGPFYQCDTTAEDSSWHGTQTAGLVGALVNNGIGMAGVGRNVQVLPVRVLGKCGGFDSDIIPGMRWAAGLSVPGVPANPNPARVLNLSLGGEGACTAAYRDVVAEINAAGAVVVASAGNTAGHAVNEPANCPGVIAVASVRHVGTKVGFSDIGSEIAISAPGGNCVTSVGACLYPILTTVNAGTTTPVVASAAYTDSFNPTLGTSFSAPLVAATAGLMLSAQPALTPAEVRSLLRSSARSFPTTGGATGTQQCTAPQFNSSGQPVDQFECYCTTSTCGAGMLDAGAALRAVLARVGIVANITLTTANPLAAQALTLSSASTALAAGSGGVVSYAWSIVDGGGIAQAFTTATNGPTAALTPSAAGAFVVRLTVQDSAGNSSSTQARVTVQAATPTPVPPPDPVVASSGGGGTLGVEWLALLLSAVLALRASAHQRADLRRSANDGRRADCEAYVLRHDRELLADKRGAG